MKRSHYRAVARRAEKAKNPNHMVRSILSRAKKLGPVIVMSRGARYIGRPAEFEMIPAVNGLPGGFSKVQKGVPFIRISEMAARA